jgi:tetratricopeptide (TPR) repeat protein
MRYIHRSLAALVLLGLSAPVRAGLYCSEEAFADLPSQWRGFLLDQRALRLLAVKPMGTTPASPLRTRYEKAVEKLTKRSAERPLTADEAADLGALHVRLGDIGRALDVLRPAQRANPSHFRLAANLGTAWQLSGDLEQAATTLQQAVRLAPGKLLRAEELHLHLVRLRKNEPRGTVGLDDLFDIRFVGPSGKYEAGKLAEEQRKKLPSDAAASLQQLALWLPMDARLLWQVGEMAGAHGDVGTAAATLDGCVIDFNLRAPELLDHRRLCRAAADELARTAPDNAMHQQGHTLAFKPRSSRPLVHDDLASLPPIDPKGVNVLPWAVMGLTALDRQARPTFPPYLKELDGRTVEVTGFMQPLGSELECGAFMLVENPIGCWWCEMPTVIGILLVELPEGKTTPYSRNALRITGKLALNATDPERFLFVIGNAKVKEME